jgi:hypothetical protein
VGQGLANDVLVWHGGDGAQAAPTGAFGVADRHCFDRLWGSANLDGDVARICGRTLDETRRWPQYLIDRTL